MTSSQPFNFVGLHHVQLSIPAGGEAESRTFWGTALGMTELVKPAVLATHLQRSGTKVTWDENFPGFSRFYSSDPFGNRLEFLEEK